MVSSKLGHHFPMWCVRARVRDIRAVQCKMQHISAAAGTDGRVRIERRREAVRLLFSAVPLLYLSCNFPAMHFIGRTNRGLSRS